MHKLHRTRLKIGARSITAITCSSPVRKRISTARFFTRPSSQTPELSPCRSEVTLLKHKHIHSHTLNSQHWSGACYIPHNHNTAQPKQLLRSAHSPPKLANQMEYAKELHIASIAVHHASILTNSVQSIIQQKGNSLEKDEFGDPVTIADFASQAMIINAIHHHFPDDTFVGEEDESMLRSSPELLERVWALVDGMEIEGDEVPRLGSREDLLRVIGLGGKEETAKGRVWMLDPIDGTKSFLTGNQYAVSLALVVDGSQKVGVLGCPNIKSGSSEVREDVVDRDGLGVLLSAVEGQGAYQRIMTQDDLGEPRKMEKLGDVEDLSELKYVNSMASDHLSKPIYLVVKDACGLKTSDEVDLWSTHVKYAALTFGGVNCMVRIPPKRSYRGFVWDHAGGQLIYEEVGGKLTDINGTRFDFGVGRKLERNWGVVAAPPSVHGKLLEVVERVLEENPIY
ncbi:carbohydrate phosphatase [Mollisia scopiformis]|uniref:Carbohydrate phosphatase n=1 Tax=Mollisia scopiformis TaxID=149040 RepID=A0A194XA16_MOLSC|nr:carbohydrate phosphatase [Mollisia scopiformis]KUJ16979.1 carbohydrate phosphatase [Mollisia scopiformis]